MRLSRLLPVLLIALALSGRAPSLRAEDWSAELKAIQADLANADPSVRQSALSKAAGLGSIDALGLVLPVFQRDGDTKVVAKAAEAIGEIHKQQTAKATPDARWKATWSKVAAALSDGLLKSREDHDLDAAILAVIAKSEDPVFVKPLSGDLWKFKDQEIASGRILALGCIRDKTAVDALMDMLYVAKARGTRKYMDTIRQAIRNLTGQTFNDRDEAKKWWKENRATFEFPAQDPNLKKKLDKRFGGKDGDDGGGGDKGDDGKGDDGK